MSAQSDTRAFIVSEAVKRAAPLVDEASRRLQLAIFGSGRATRCTDVVVYNSSKYVFSLVPNSARLETGTWTSAMMPPADIPANGTVVYGSESHGVCTGATNCELQYECSAGMVNISTSNPYMGDNHAEVSHTFADGAAIVHHVCGGGNANTVHVYIA